MDISVEVCTDNYVVTCTPQPKVSLPECEYGWELGNGTAVCASEPAPSASLAATGGDLGAVLGVGLLAVALVCVGLALLARRRRR